MKKLTFILITLIISALATTPIKAQGYSAPNPESYNITVVGEITVVNNNNGNLEAFFLAEETFSSNSSDLIKVIKNFKVVFNENIPEDKLFILKWSKEKEKPITIKARWGFDSTTFQVQDINYWPGLSASK